MFLHGSQRVLRWREHCLRAPESRQNSGEAVGPFVRVVSADLLLCRHVVLAVLYGLFVVSVGSGGRRGSPGGLGSLWFVAVVVVVVVVVDTVVGVSITVGKSTPA